MAASASVESASSAPEAVRTPEKKPRLIERLFEPVAFDFLVYFRLAFGAIMLWEMVRYLEAGWVKQNFIDPPLHFTFYGFSWVRPWPGEGMYWHFYVMAVLAGLITVGLCYRAAAALFFVGFTYLFLIDQAYYLNHFYLVCLISFVMIFLPASQAFSLDAWVRRRMESLRAAARVRAKPQAEAKPQADRDASSETPGDRSVVPVWTLWILRVLVGITYSYGALAKLNMDWLTGNPMREMLAQADTFPVLGRLFHLEPVILFYAWGGLLLDLLIVPALCWKRTRLFALLAAAFFHLSNDQMFQIGIFPWFMLTATLLLWPPRKLQPLWLSRTVLGTVYVYACVAMMNTPWGPWGEEAAVRLVAMSASIACLPLMFWKPARLPAFLVGAAWLLIAPRTEYFGFGGLPGTLVSILPGLLIWGAIALFPPDSLRNFRIVGESSGRRATPVTPSATANGLRFGQKLTVVFLGLFVVVQCVVPFRHWLYPGNVHWTEEGHLFAWHMKLRYKNGRAAFRAFTSHGKPIPLLLADGYLIAEQDAGGGLTHVLDADGNRLFALRPRDGRFVAVDVNGIPVYELNANGWLTYELNDKGEPIYALDLNGERIYPRDGGGEPILVLDERGEPIPPREPPYYLTPRQRTKMAERPEMLLQYAHFLADALRRQGYENVDIRADAFCSLNGRVEQRLIDPEVNLAAVESTLGHADWILPLDPNLKPGVLYRRELTQSDEME